MVYLWDHLSLWPLQKKNQTKELVFFTKLFEMWLHSAEQIQTVCQLCNILFFLETSFLHSVFHLNIHTEEAAIGSQDLIHGETKQERLLPEKPYFMTTGYMDCNLQKGFKSTCLYRYLFVTDCCKWYYK